MQRLGSVPIQPQMGVPVSICEAPILCRELGTERDSELGVTKGEEATLIFPNQRQLMEALMGSTGRGVSFQVEKEAGVQSKESE